MVVLSSVILKLPVRFHPMSAVIDASLISSCVKQTDTYASSSDGLQCVQMTE